MLREFDLGYVQSAQEELTVMHPRRQDRLAAFVGKMTYAGLPPLMVQIFGYYYNQLVDGATGYIDNDEAQPICELPEAADLTAIHDEIGQAALDRVVLLKLNGGLGTSMGIQGPKSLLPAKDELTFLDIVIRQVMHLRTTFGARLPLLLMDSFNTQADALAALARYTTFKQDVPLSFLQHKVPKVNKADLQPATWSADPAKEWCPPGHGDIYAALITSGVLQQLLDAGYEYAFVSNSDNLGAVLDPKILGYMVQAELPFLMEVAYRTPADRKGGHLARRPDGQLILREVAQCPPAAMAAFQDIERYRYFNTNNLWVHLPTLQKVVRDRNGILGLPLIRNEKPVDPTDPDSPRVYQLETAMGSAIACFQGAQALCVPRERFVPVKKNNDLLVLWSDAYTLRPDYHLQLATHSDRTEGQTTPLVFLDDRYYQLIDDMRQRFPHGAPSLVGCTELRVEGDVSFGQNIVLKGKVHIVNDSDGFFTIADGTVLDNCVVHG
ncbi:MAG: UTP--glucose-1-phosphate uridylyltransferase [Caldilineaceae bacterium]